MKTRTLNANLHCWQCGESVPHLLADTKLVDDVHNGGKAVEVYYRCSQCCNARLWGFERKPYDWASSPSRLKRQCKRGSYVEPISAAQVK